MKHLFKVILKSDNISALLKNTGEENIQVIFDKILN